jgi:hypothetical protein
VFCRYWSRNVDKLAKPVWKPGAKHQLAACSDWVRHARLQWPGATQHCLWLL